MEKMFLKISRNLRESTYVRLFFSFGLSSVISNVSVVALSMDLFAGKVIEQQLLLLESLKYLPQQTNT